MATKPPTSSIHIPWIWHSYSHESHQTWLLYHIACHRKYGGKNCASGMVNSYHFFWHLKWSYEWEKNTECQKEIYVDNGDIMRCMYVYIILYYIILYYIILYYIILYYIIYIIYYIILYYIISYYIILYYIILYYIYYILYYIYYILYHTILYYIILYYIILYYIILYDTISYYIILYYIILYYIVLYYIILYYIILYYIILYYIIYIIYYILYIILYYIILYYIILYYIILYYIYYILYYIILYILYIISYYIILYYIIYIYCFYWISVQFVFQSYCFFSHGCSFLQLGVVWEWGSHDGDSPSFPVNLGILCWDRGWDWCPVVFHISQLYIGDINSNRYGCFGDVKQIPNYRDINPNPCGMFPTVCTTNYTNKRGNNITTDGLKDHLYQIGESKQGEI